MENNNIAINSLQHFVFCKRQWALVYMEGLWLDNYKTVEGNIVHTLVDDPFFNESRKDLRISRSVPVYLDEINLHGICDCVEFTKDKITVVEYKNGKPNEKTTVNYHDGIQLAAQMMCVNNMFNASCDGYIYYNTINRRVQLKSEEQEKYFSDVKDIAAEIKEILRTKAIPAKANKQNCHNCSMSDICMPKTDTRISVKDRMKKSWEVENA